MIRRILKTYKENLLNIIVFLLIVTIALYAIKFSDVLTDRSERLLTVIAAISSTFFLFLAFRESRISNQLKITEPVLLQFEKDINILFEKQHDKVFTDDFAKLLNKSIGYPEYNIENFKFSNFQDMLVGLICFINLHTNYNTIIDTISKKQALNISDNDYNNMCYILQRIYTSVFVFESLYSAISTQFTKIDDSELDKKQKLYLFGKLNILCRNYDSLLDRFKNSDKNSDPLKKFRAILTHDDQNIEIVNLDLNFMFLINKNIKLISQKYFQ